jgi:hypothetical protein
VKQDQALQGNNGSRKVQSEKIRYGAPDGPRKKRRENFDGSKPLEFFGHEVLAQHLGSPKFLRKLKSGTDLAKSLRVCRLTIFRWKQDPDVIQRAYFLSEINQIAGDLLARQAWPEIMQKAVQKAIEGDLQSIRFCESRAFPKKLHVEQSHVGTTISIQDLFGASESHDAEELLDKNRQGEGDEQ